MTRSQRRANRTRKRLLDAALAMISDKGIAATTIEDITENADVGKGTFYRHFSSKEEVLGALVDAAIDHLIAYVGHPQPVPASVEAAVEHLVNAHSAFFVERPSEFALLQGSLFPRLQRERPGEFEQPYTRYVRQIVEQVSAFLSAPPDPAKVRLLTRALLGFISGYLPFALIGMTAQEIRASLEPLRRLFVARSSAFLGAPKAPPKAPPDKTFTEPPRRTEQNKEPSES